MQINKGLKVGESGENLGIRHEMEQTLFELLFNYQTHPKLSVLHPEESRYTHRRDT